MTNVFNTNFNNNFLSPVGFKFKLTRLPVFEHFVQSVNLPDLGMILNEGQSTPFINIPQVGNAAEFSKLNVTFKIDENLIGWITIFDWIKGITRIDAFDPYATLKAEKPPAGIESDATLVLLNSALSPTINFYFKDLFPIHLSGFQMDTTNRDIDYVTSTVTFNYTSYNYEILK